MDRFIPTLLQIPATLMSTISVFGSPMHPSSPLACSAAVPGSSNGDNCDCIAPLRARSCSELLQLEHLQSLRTHGVDGSLPEVEAHPDVCVSLSCSTQSVLMWLRPVEVWICSSMCVCSVEHRALTAVGSFQPAMPPPGKLPVLSKKLYRQPMGGFTGLEKQV